MKNCLRIAVSLGVLLAAVFSSGQDPTESWKPVQKIARAKESGWEQELLDSIEDVDQFSDDLAIYKNPKSTPAKKKDAMASILARIDRYVDSENVAVRQNSTKKAAEILSRTEFKSMKDAPGKSWVQRILERLEKLRMRDQKKDDNQIDFPDLPWLAPLLRVLMFAILITAVGLLIWLLTKLRFMSQMRKEKTRSGGGILEDGEELLSEDEYLKNADDLIAQGRFREACRALYLATLVRLDAARIARLEPTQTNWEHLRRVETSRTKPEGLDFRTPTKLFDHAWYGYAARSATDVEPFRRAYLDIKQLTEVKAA
ncbi:MAG: DUF4129 domain-containing protein [Armatimonadota bacterium]